MKFPFRALFVVGAIVTMTAAAPPAKAPPHPAALAKLEKGLWQLRDLDNAGAAHAPVCVGDPILLVQLRHRSAPCSRLVVSQDPDSARIHYTCASAGYGHTFIRVETPRLAQIETQGIAGKVPFAARIEARRAGSCGANYSPR